MFGFEIGIVFIAVIVWAFIGKYLSSAFLAICLRLFGFSGKNIKDIFKGKQPEAEVKVGFAKAVALIFGIILSAFLAGPYAWGKGIQAAAIASDKSKTP